MWLSRCAGALLPQIKEGNVLVVWTLTGLRERELGHAVQAARAALTDEMKQLQAERPAIFGGRGRRSRTTSSMLGEEHMVSRLQIGTSSRASRSSSRSSGHPELAGGVVSSASRRTELVFIDEVPRPLVYNAIPAVATNIGECAPAREDYDDHATHNDDILRVAPYQLRDRPPAARCPGDA